MRDPFGSAGNMRVLHSVALGWANGRGPNTSGAAAVSGSALRFVVAGRPMGTRTLALLALLVACRDNAAGSGLVVVGPGWSEPIPARETPDPSRGRPLPHQEKTKAPQDQSDHLRALTEAFFSRPQRRCPPPPKGSVWVDCL